MVEFIGTLVSGTGRGKKFISMPVYSLIFEENLGKSPFPGTFNLDFDRKFSELVAKQFQEGIVFDGLLHDGKPTGGIVINRFDIIIKGRKINVVGVRPHLTVHNGTVLEIVSSHFIREEFSLIDDDQIIISIDN